jgi:hypothetical protein
MNLKELSAQLRLCRYPDQMEFVECGILGAGFYPGTKGYAGNAMPSDGIMLLGRDFGTKKYYTRLCGNPPRDETANTWRKTRDIYMTALAEVPVWCTNYLMGVRKDGSSVDNVKKRITPSDWELFERDCWALLQAQVLLQHPRLVVILGGDNRDDLTVTWRLGTITESETRHTFVVGNRRHTARVVLGDHPHSLIPRVRQEAARRDAERWKRLYQATPACKCRAGI